MKAIFVSAILVISFTATAQYYYKDIVGTRETSQMIRAYQANKVNRVVLNSFDAQGQRLEDFYVEQVFSPSALTLTTITRSSVSGESVLIAYINKDGRVVKTADSSENLISKSIYSYDPVGNLLSVVSSSQDPSKSITQTEEHLWQYSNGNITRMLRIKNKVDTTIVNFKKDDAGNIIEEMSVRKGVQADPVLYYYDSHNRLTDIVRFNPKVKRLLPEYMFEYSPSHQVIQKITVPANSSNYLIWRYQFDERGLKVQEAVFDRQKKLTGRIRYEYSF